MGELVPRGDCPKLTGQSGESQNVSSVLVMPFPLTFHRVYCNQVSTEEDHFVLRISGEL